MIVKPSDDEAILLDRCLQFLKGNVDEMCITQAGVAPNKRVSEIIKKYGGTESFFKWTHNFAEARNYNFAQATNDYIFWCDSDDAIRGAELLKKLVKKMDKDKMDTVIMHYLYDFDKTGQCTVKHLKTRLVKKGCVEWIGEVHEDFSPLRKIAGFFTDEIEVLHLTDKDRAKQSSERNIQIAQTFLDKHPGDPRGYWLMANALLGEGRKSEVIPYLDKFIKTSGSEDEIFLAHLMIGDIEQKDDHYLRAFAIKPNYPDPYLRLGQLYASATKMSTLRKAAELIIIGLSKQKKDKELIVYNPRDYDFNPMMILAEVYSKLGEFKNSVEVLKRCITMYPNDKKLIGKKEIVMKQVEFDRKAEEAIEKAEKIKDKKKLRKYIDGLEDDIKSHPMLSFFRNKHFIKETSTGKDIAYYCSHTDKTWTPLTAKKDGVGGSEEAVINLSDKLSAKGWDVTVYNNCGSKTRYFTGSMEVFKCEDTSNPKELEFYQDDRGTWMYTDKSWISICIVTYTPYYEFNIKDKWDAIILWRQAMPVDHELNTERIFIDVHDVLQEGEFTPDRLTKIEKIFVKSEAHRNLYPKVPDDKFAVIPNGVDVTLFEKREKNPYLILNTSSPDRHLDATLDIFEELIKKQPDRPWKLAWYYGWDNYKKWHQDNQEMMAYYKKQSARFDKLVKEGRAEGGMMVNHETIAKKYEEATYFLYPTQFFEIHCISAIKAQLAGCRMVTSDFAALDESVQHGIKVHTEGEKWERKDVNFGDDQVEKYIEAIELVQDEPGSVRWAKDTYNWDKISEQWNEHLSLDT